MQNTTRLTACLFSLAAVFFLAACSSEPEPVEEQAEAVSETVQREAPDRSRSTSNNSPTMENLPTPESSNRHRFVPDVEGQLNEPGSGLQSIIDGTSSEAFNDSLAWISSDSSKEQYAKLEQAIRFINAYDSTVLGNDDKMRQRLDGMTGQEVLELASEINSNRSGTRGN